MTSLVAEVLADSPTVYLPLDEVSGASAFDASGAGLTATLTGSPTATADALAPSGRCLLFNGSSQYGATAASIAIVGTQSIECWVNKTSGTGLYSIAGLGTTGNPAPLGFDTYGNGGDNRWRVFTTTSAGGIHMAAYGPTAQSIVNGQWYHLVGTYDSAGPTLSLYVDGVLVGTNSFGPSGSQDTTTRALQVARYNGTFTQYFPGKIAHVAVYPSTLSAARVLAHYAAAKGPTSAPDSYTDWLLAQPTLLGAYHLQDTSGLVADGTPVDGTISAAGVTYSLAGPSPVLPLALGTNGTTGDIAFPTSMAASLGTTVPQTWAWWQYRSVETTSASAQLFPFGDRTAAGNYLYFVFGSSSGDLSNEVFAIFHVTGATRTGFSGFTIPAGWHHHCATFSGTQGGWTYYLDGVATGTRQNFNSGAHGWLSGESYAFGLVDGTYVTVERAAGFALFRSELTAAQVSVLYRAGRANAVPAGLTSY